MVDLTAFAPSKRGAAVAEFMVTGPNPFEPGTLRLCAAQRKLVRSI